MLWKLFALSWKKSCKWSFQTRRHAIVHLLVSLVIYKFKLLQRRERSHYCFFVSVLLAMVSTRIVQVGGIHVGGHLRRPAGQGSPSTFLMCSKFDNKAIRSLYLIVALPYSIKSPTHIWHILYFMKHNLWIVILICFSNIFFVTLY